MGMMNVKVVSIPLKIKDRFNLEYGLPYRNFDKKVGEFIKEYGNKAYVGYGYTPKENPNYPMENLNLAPGNIIIGYLKGLEKDDAIVEIINEIEGVDFSKDVEIAFNMMASIEDGYIDIHRIAGVNVVTKARDTGQDSNA